jgi:hypothetical protein
MVAGVDPGQVIPGRWRYVGDYSKFMKSPVYHPTFHSLTGLSALKVHNFVANHTSLESFD